MYRPISTRTHGWLDHASALALFAVPRLLGWDRGVRRFTDLAALGTVAYARLTDYEAGSVPVLSVKQHLAVDLMEGATFLSAAYMMKDEAPQVRWALAGYGLFALAAGAMTEPYARSGHRPRRIGRTSGSGRRTGSGAWVMDDVLNEQDGPENMEETMDRTQQTAGSNRVGESEWRQSRRATYDTTLRARADVGRNANPGIGGNSVGTAEWRQSTEHRRHDMATAGSGSHESSGKLGPLDARRGYRDGQGI